VHVSGQGPVDPETGDIVGTDITARTERTLLNIDAILQSAGTDMDGVVKTTVFLTDMGDYDAVNEIYEKHLITPYPARSAVEVGELPVDIGVEIEAISEY